MRDPHVQLLHFSVGSGEGINYRDPEPVRFSTHLGVFALADGKLSITPSEHFSEEEDALQAIEPFLRAWEMEADLASNHGGMIRFSFERADLIDLDPPPPGFPQAISLKGSASASAFGTVSVEVNCRKYPPPPSAFRVTPEVQHAYQRWSGYRSGKEPLQAMAYFVLTSLASAGGGRLNAARVFNIEIAVLGTIGRLSSTKGAPSTARKAGQGTQFQELTGTEKQWLEKAVTLVIRRLGEHASGAPTAPICMSDLPALL